MSSSKKLKKPMQEHSPHPGKFVRQAEDPDKQGPPWKWSFQQMDMDGLFGWQNCVQFPYVLKKLGEREKLTFQQLRENGSHNVEVSKFSRDAQK